MINVIGHVVCCLLELIKPIAHGNTSMTSLNHIQIIARIAKGIRIGHIPLQHLHKLLNGCTLTDAFPGNLTGFLSFFDMIAGCGNQSQLWTHYLLKVIHDFFCGKADIDFQNILTAILGEWFGTEFLQLILKGCKPWIKGN